MATACGIQFAGAEALRISQLTACGDGGAQYVTYGPETIAEVSFSEEIDAPDDRERTGMNGRLQGSISQVPTTKYRTITVTANARVPELDYLLRGARLILDASGNSTGAGMCSQADAKVALEIFAPEDISSCDSAAQDLAFLFPMTSHWIETGDTTISGAEGGQTVYEGRGYANTAFDIWPALWSATEPTGTATAIFDEDDCFIYNKFAAASRPAVSCTLTTLP